MYQGTILEFLNMGGGEIALIMVAILLLFGGKKLPELARGLGKGIREFKDASEGVKREIHRNINAVSADDEVKAEEENHAARHHPTEEVALPSSEEPIEESTITENDTVAVPQKGKESHIE